MSRDNTLQILMIPTRNCNFRCPYCYEDHINYVMDDEIYKQTISFIVNLVKLQKYNCVLISWFGGEPMLEYNNICRFMKNLKEHLPLGIKLRGNMTTNGYFLSLDKLKTLVSLNIDDYQITVDGLEEYHNKTRFLVGGFGTWSTINKNLTDARNSTINFKILIRTNFSQDLSDNTDVWFDYLSQTFGQDNRFTYHFELIKDLGGVDKSYKHINKDNAIKKILFSANQYNLTLNSFTPRLSPFSLMCYASNPHSMLIDYDGKIKKCTVCLDAEHNIVGDVKDGIINENNFAWWTDYDIKEECKKCEIFPTCYACKCPAAYFDISSCSQVKETYFGTLNAIL